MSHATNMLKRQSEICAHDENRNRMKTRGDDRSKNNTTMKKEVKMDIRGCTINDTNSY